MNNPENAKELNELEEKEVAGGRFSVISPGETPNSPVLPDYLKPKPEDNQQEPKDGGATGGW